MKIHSTLLFSFLLTTFSCRQASEQSDQPNIQSKDLVSKSKVFRKDICFTNSDITIDYIIFGIICPECESHCATMYKLIVNGNSNTLFIDSSDGGFKNHKVRKFEKVLNDSDILNLAQSILKQIPIEILTTTKQDEKYGFSTYTDECVIYFELKQGNKVKKFNDYPLLGARCIP